MPSDRTTLLALAERAERGGDKTLSDDCWIALGWRKDPKFLGWWIAPNEWEPHLARQQPGPRPSLTTSIDAQEVVPGRVMSSATDGKQWHATSRPGQTDPSWPSDAFAPTEALARLAAKLRAMAAQEGGDG